MFLSSGCAHRCPDRVIGITRLLGPWHLLTPWNHGIILPLNFASRRTTTSSRTISLLCLVFLVGYLMYTKNGDVEATRREICIWSKRPLLFPGPAIFPAVPPSSWRACTSPFPSLPPSGLPPATTDLTFLRVQTPLQSLSRTQRRYKVLGGKS